MGRDWKVLQVVGLLFLVAGCSGDAEQPRNEAASWSVAEAPTVRIGGQEGASEYLFDRITVVRMLPDGRILVADRGTNSLRVFDTTGRLVAEWGRSGEGPGEYRWIRHVEALGPDTLAIYDAELYRLTLLETDGTVLGTHRVEAPTGTPETVLGRYANGDWALAWIVSQSVDRDLSDPDADPMEMGRFGPDGAFIESLGRGEGMVRQALGPRLSGPVPFSPFFHGLLVQDSVWFTNGQTNALKILGAEGEVARVLRVDLPAQDPETARVALRSTLAEREELDRFEQISEAVWSRPVPRISEVLRGEEERVWLKHYDPRRDSWLVGGMGGRSQGGNWTVVETDGSVVSTVQMPDRFMPMDIRSGWIAGISVDRFGVERVEIRELER